MATRLSLRTATSTHALPDASENEHLNHINSGKADTSYRSPMMSRMKSLDFLGFNATRSTKSSRVRKLARWVGESKKAAPVGESTCTVSRCGFGADAYITVSPAMGKPSAAKGM